MRLKWFAKNESGATAVYFALIAPVIIGFAAMGVEATLWLATQRKLQHIADSAAFSGAVRSLSTANLVKIVATSVATAEESGKQATDSMAVNLPPTTGAFHGAGGYVEVTISRDLPRYLTTLIVGSSDPVTISARAVAGIRGGSGERVCMLALSVTASGSFTVSGSGTVDVQDCAFASNSSAPDGFDMVGARVRVSGACLYTVGGADTGTGLELSGCDAPQTLQTPISDPYAALAMPSASDVASQPAVPSSALTASKCANDATTYCYTPTTYLPSYPELPVARFSGGLSVSGNTHLNPGLYIIDGGTLKINAQTYLSGEGVSFYLTNGAKLDVNGGATLNVSGYDPDSSTPRTDPFAGLLFFGDREGTPVSNALSGTAASITDGIIYFPNDTLTYTGNSGSTYPCLEIMADKLTITGSGTVYLGCPPKLPSDAPTVRGGQKIGLVE